MRKIIVAVCVAVSVMIAAAASAQSPAEERQRAAAAELEAALAAEAQAAEAVRTEASATAEAQRASAAEAQGVMAAEAEAELARLRTELEQARARLEAAARDLASRAVPGTSSFIRVGPDETVLFGGGAGRPRTPIGAVLVDAAGGALVTEVVSGSGASDAGIEVGDLIQSIDGIDLSAEGSPSANILERLMEPEPGDSVTLAVERAGDVLDYDVEITEGYPWITATQPLQNRIAYQLSRIGDERPKASGQSPGAVVISNPGELYGLQRLRSLKFAASEWGEMELVPVTSGLARYFGTEEGLLVIRGPADESIGVEDGDVILTIGGRTPSSPEHAIRILASFEPGETIEFSIMRERVRETVEYAVP